MASIDLHLASKSKEMPEDIYDKITRLSFENGGNGIEIIPDNYEEFPLPWDADCYIEKGKFIMVGGAGPGGYGFARTEVPLNRMSGLELKISVFDAEAESELREILAEYDWI